MAVPTALPIEFSDVCLEIYGSTNTSGKSLSGLFTDANGSFNATYSGSKDRLTNFRGYVQRSLEISSTNCHFDDMGTPCNTGEDYFAISSTEPWYSATFPGGGGISPDTGTAGVTWVYAQWGGTNSTQTVYFYYTSDDTLTDPYFTIINLDVGEACI